MKNKVIRCKLVVIALSVTIGIGALTGCSNSIDSENNSVAENTVDEGYNNSSNNSEVGSGSSDNNMELSGTKDNPVRIGETKGALLGGERKLTITVNSVERGDDTNQKVADKNWLNRPPKDGYEFMLVNMTIEVIDEKGELDISPLPYEFVDMNGEVFGIEHNTVAPDDILLPPIVEGTKSGELVDQVKIGEEVMLNMGGLWFSLSE